MSKTESASTTTTRGPVLEVLRDLLDQGQLDAVLELVSKLVARNSELERKLAEIRSPRRTNEGVSSAQLALLLESLASTGDATRDEADQKLRKTTEDVAPAPRDGTPAPRQPSLRRPLPANLRRVPNPISVPPSTRACPRCGKDRRCIGHDTTEILDLIPAEVIVRVDSREKLACDDCEAEVVRAPLGDKVVEGGRMGCALVANLLVEKYRDGLPLHRQRDRFERLGVELSVSTLADQVTWATELLAPLVRAAKERTLAAKIMHFDGTGLPVLDRDATNKRVGTGKRIGTLWGCVGDDSAFYFYASTGKKIGQRPGEIGPEDLLKLRTGYTVADAATMFDKSFARDGIIECGCNMHARRKFVAALEGGDHRASLPVSAYKVLYQIEDEIRDLDRDARMSERATKSAAVCGELIRWCEKHQPFELPKSPMGSGIRYVLNHQDALLRFLDDPDIPLDNGAVERMHVRVALTRKNFLFAGSDAGGVRAAAAYTILGCCTLADVEPVAYLTDVLARLSRRVREADAADLLPASWKAARG
jgi:transposase